MQKSIRNYELEITNNKCRLLRRNFWERQHLAGFYSNVAQASCLCFPGRLARFLKKTVELPDDTKSMNQFDRRLLIFREEEPMFAVTIPAKPLALRHAQIGGLLFFIIDFLKNSDSYSFSQLLPLGSVPHAEPPVGLFFHIVFAPFILGTKLLTAYLPRLCSACEIRRVFYFLWKSCLIENPSKSFQCKDFMTSGTFCKRTC